MYTKCIYKIEKTEKVSKHVHPLTSELYLNDQISPNTKQTKQEIYKYYSLQTGFDRNNHHCLTQPPQKRFWAAGNAWSLYTLFQILYPV